MKLWINIKMGTMLRWSLLPALHLLTQMERNMMIVFPLSDWSNKKVPQQKFEKLLYPMMNVYRNLGYILRA